MIQGCVCVTRCVCVWVCVCVCVLSSYDRGSTYNVFVGKKQLISGMDKALVGMCVNQRSLVKIPPQLAYGKGGYGECVPRTQCVKRACSGA